MSPPERREPPAGNRGPNYIAANDNPNDTPTAVVVPLHGGLDRWRREQLQLALDSVPISTGYAAGLASVYLPCLLSRARARRRLGELRQLWHADVDRSIDRALAELAS